MTHGSVQRQALDRLGQPHHYDALQGRGTSGPFMPEIRQPAPHAVYVPRKGEANAWDNADFVKAARAAGPNTLIMAGAWTSASVMFPALDTEATGCRAYAAGGPRETASRTSLAVFIQGGVIPTTTDAVLSEVHCTWMRPEAAETAKPYPHVSPNYAAVVERYDKAREVAKRSRSGRCVDRLC
jgi:hypothetical protein